MAEETCDHEAWDSFNRRSRVCGRPVKAGGLCGIHLAAKKRREESAARKAVRRQESDAAASEVKVFLADHDIQGSPFYHPREHRYTGDVVISLDELRRIMGASS